MYFTVAYAIDIQNNIIEISGGFKGLKDVRYLESPLEQIQNDDYYPNFTQKLCHLVFAINKFHAFNDGNKRTSIAMGAYFLIINGFSPVVNRFIIEMENIAVAVADNIIDKALLQDIIDSIISEVEYSETLKLEMIHAIAKTKTIQMFLLEQDKNTDF